MNEENLEVEEVEDLDEEEQEGVFTVDDEILDDEEVAEEVDESKEKEDKTSVVDDSFTKLKENYDRASNHIEDLNKTIKYLRKENAEKLASKDDEEVTLTDDQIKGLLEAHEGDHGTTLEIIKHVSKQMAKGVSKEEIKTEGIVKTQQELNKFMSTTYPMLNDAESPFAKQVQEFKNKMQLSDHPYSDFLAVSSMVHGNIQNIQKESYEKGLSDGRSGKAESIRKQKIKTDGLLSAGDPAAGKKSTKLSAKEVRVANEIGLKTPSQLKLYASMLKR
jgi:hypothetical protein